MFELGDIVECVDARANPNWGRPDLHLGKLYTVRAVGGPLWNSLVQRETFTVHLREARSQSDWGFSAHRFRLLKRRDPDLIAKLLKEPEPDLVSDMVEF